MKHQQIELDVLGMTCPSCVRHVNSALTELEGVAKVEVHLRDGKVLVQYDPELVEPSALTQALHEAGYDAALSLAAS